MSFSVVQGILAAHGRKLLGSGLIGMAAGYSFARDHHPFEATFRFLSTTSVATSIAADYQLTKCEDDEQCWSQLHCRSAEKLLALCLKQGGVYVKAGQYMASLTHVLPMEYITIMARLQDHAHPRPFTDVVRLFKQEHKRHPNDVFSWFDPHPIAAASLAQVHRATLRPSGTNVAVKIQYPRLNQLFISDLLTMTNVCKSLMYFYPNLDLMWMVDEFRSNLMKELDFRLEGRSAERVAKLLAWRDDVAVPKIFWRWTTDKILVMDYIEGVKVNDIKGLSTMNFNPREVGAIVCDVFAEMIFEHGFIHGDPHPGNILVRPRPGRGRKPQVVLLDHGLYQELSDEFRVDYCELWKACIFLDRDRIREISAKFNVEQYYKFFPLVFTFRALPEQGSLGGKLGDPVSKEEALKQIQGLGVEFSAGGVTESLNRFLSSIPRQMLLILKTQNLVRHINKELGGSTLGRVESMFTHAVRGVYIETSYRAWWRRLMSNLLGELNVWRMRIALFCIEAGARWRDFDWRHLRFRTGLMIG